MRDARGQLADGFELLRLAQVVFEPVALLERLLEHRDVGETAFPSGECLRCVVQRRGIDENVQVAALAVLDRRLPMLYGALLGDLVEELRALAGFEQQVEEVDLVERHPLAGKQFDASGIRGLEHAVLVGGEQRHRHVVEQILVAARGAQQVAMEIVALHRVRNDAREHGGVDAALLQVILRAFAHGREALLVVVGPGEHDDRREIRDRAQRDQRFQPGGVGQAEIEEDQVVLLLLQALRGFGDGLYPVAGDSAAGVGEVALDHAGIRRVVFD